VPAGKGAPGSSRLRRLLARPSPDRRDLLEAAAWLWLLRLAMRIAGVRRVHDRLARWSGTPIRSSVDGRATAGRLARIVEAAAGNTSRDHTCLHRSLVLWYLCRRRGVPVTIALGARRTPAGLEAHAWVEHDGVVVNDTTSVQRDYVPLAWTAVGRRV
jgi:hypothetical protein